MKFLTCSRCLEDDQQLTTNHQIQEISNPLVITKRPKYQTYQSSSSSPKQKSSFPFILSNFIAWPRRKKKSQSVRIGSIRVIEPPPPPRRRYRHRPTSRTQRLIKMYEDRASSPEPCIHQYQEYVIEPPASFSGDDSLESHQNFRNKLNTLDFKRMNTVALEASPGTPSKSETSIYRNNSYTEEPSSTAKFARKTMLEDFLKERPKIEQTMIDLFNTKRARSEERKVRFNVDADDCTRGDQETEIKLEVDPETKVEDFFVEKRTTYLKHKKVEDKSLVLKIAPRDGREDDEDAGREMVFKNFGKMTI